MITKNKLRSLGYLSGGAYLLTKCRKGDISNIELEVSL